MIISFSWLDRDPRVSRQICFLKNRFKIIAAGFTHPAVDNIKFFKISPSRLNILHKLKIVFFNILKLYEKAYWTSPRIKNALRALKDVKKVDVILANDLNTLPLGALLAQKWDSKLICDLHEYAPAEFDANPLWRHIMSPYNNYLCKKYLPYTDKVMTVCKSIADKYNYFYKVKCDIIDNAAPYVNQKPTITKDNEIKIIHHGIAVPERKIENMIFLMKLLDKRYKLDLMLMPYNKNYMKKLKQLVNKNNRIRIIKPISPERISQYINQYDIGLFLLPPEHLNYYMALPNKLFEFIQARLCIAIWPSLEMKKIVKKYKCGIVTKAFSLNEIAERLNSLSADKIYSYKLNSHEAAKELCAERNKEIFLNIIGSLS